MRLFFRHFGSGQPMIILHGLYGLSDNWVTLARNAAANFEVFLPDLRNHGQSPHSPILNYPAMADDLLEFLEVNRIEKPVLMGHSMGGKVVMQLSCDYPHLAEKIIVVDIAPKAYPSRNLHLEILDAMMSVDFNHINQRTQVEEIVGEKITDQRIRLFILKNLHRLDHNRYNWKVNLEAVSQNLDVLAGAIDLPQTFDKPALFVRGGKSDYILDDDYPLIRRYFPVSLIHTIENASHWVHADAPRQLCSIISKFTNRDCEFEEKTKGEPLSTSG